MLFAIDPVDTKYSICKEDKWYALANGKTLWSDRFIGLVVSKEKNILVFVGSPADAAFYSRKLQGEGWNSLVAMKIPAARGKVLLRGFLNETNISSADLNALESLNPWLIK